MRARAVSQTVAECRMMSTDELQVYTSLGRSSAVKLAEEIGAKVKIGGRVLWDRRKIDQYFDELTGVKAGEK